MDNLQHWWETFARLPMVLFTSTKKMSNDAFYKVRVNLRLTFTLGNASPTLFTNSVVSLTCLTSHKLEVDAPPLI